MDESSLRKQFERWAKITRPVLFLTRKGQGYLNKDTHAAWRAWKECFYLTNHSES